MDTKQNRMRFLDLLEKLGNFLPHPAIIFVYLIAILFIGSAIASYFGLSVMDPRNPEKEIVIVNLLSMPEFVRFSTSLVSNFSNFPPLGSVLIAMLGIGVAEASGFLGALIKLTVLVTPKRFMTVIIVLTGVLSNIASDVGYVVLIPLAGMIFHSLGRHPLAGIAAAFAGVSGGFSANLLIGTLDPILAGITTKAAQIIDPNYVVGVEANWYFMCVSTFLIAIVGCLVTEKIVEPRLGKYESNEPAQAIETITPIEKKALIYAFASMGVYLLIIAFMVLPSDSLLRNPDTGSLVGSPFLKAVIFYVFFLFVIPGIVFGVVTEKFVSAESIISAMGKSMESMAMVLVIIFFAAQFIALFSWSNIGTFLAVKGASALQGLDLDKGVLLIGFVVVSGFINLMMSSASAQWALTSPIFVPMLMLLGYSPELIQTAYRIGDSTTNLITPLLTYLPVILNAAMRYKRDIGMGTMISMMLPYAVTFLVGWSALLYVWVFIFDLPVGPGAESFYTAALSQG